MIKHQDKKKNVSEKSDTEKETFKKRDHEVEESLRTIYEEQEGEMPDLTKLEPVRSNYWIWVTAIIAGVILFLSASAWIGFSFFKNFQGFSGKGLTVTIEGPEQISLGQETTYFINYENILREPLASVDIRVNFPTDFTITSVQPSSNEKHLAWKVGALAAEERGTITVRGRFTGELGTVSAIQAIGTYRPANFSSDFEAMTTKQISYAKTVLEGFIQVPEKAVPGERMAIIYHLKNTGADSLKDLEARLILPQGFTPDKDTLGKSVIEGLIFKKKIDELAAGSSTEVGVTGVFASGYGGDVEVEGRLGKISKEEIFSAMHLAEASFPVLAGDLSLKFVVNGSDHNDRTVAYGDSLRGVIGYENTADEPLKGITLRLKLEAIDKNTDESISDAVLVNWDDTTASPTSTRNGNEFVWSKDLSDLKEILPHGSGTVSVSIALTKKAPVQGLLALRATIEADIEAIGDTPMKRTIQMTPMLFVLRSDVSLNAETRYFSEEGAPFGSGPLPPQVGKPTSYRVIWRLQKSVHSLKNAEVSAALPKNVRFVQVATSTVGEFTFDEKSRQVVWTLNRMPLSANEAEVEFDIELTPSLIDDGRFADLIGDATFQAMDEDIDESLLQVVKGVNTDLQNDESAKGKGVVRKVVE